MGGFSRGLYDHHMLVTEVISASALRVIHYAAVTEGTDGGVGASVSSFTSLGNSKESARIIEEAIDVSPEDLELLEYLDGITKFSGEDAIERARQRLHETDYGLFCNNCECLVNWALRDEAVSYQAVHGAVASAQGAVQGAVRAYQQQGTVASALYGAMVGIVGGYIDHREKRE